MQGLVYQIHQFCQKEGLLTHGDRCLVAWSTGLDSTALVCLLLKLQLDLTLELVHFNHGIRPDSAAEAHWAKEQAQRWGLTLHLFDQPPAWSKTGLQAQARRWRRQELERLAQERDADKILTAHHLDDLAETQLWRLGRGTSLLGLAPMQTKKGRWIKPLLFTPKEQLQDFLCGQGQDWKEDRSNQEPTYTRNRLRQELIPLWGQISGVEVKQKLLGLYQDSLELQAWFDRLYAPSIWQAPSLTYSLLQEAPPFFGRELLHRFLLYQDQEEINRDNLDRALNLVLANQGGWSLDLKGGVRLLGQSKLVFLHPDK